MTVSMRSWNKLDKACKLTRDLVVKNPVKSDYSSDYMVVQGWPFVVALYSGAEQALKLLLLAQPNPQFTLDDLEKQPYRHDLETLFAALPLDDRDHIELHFREHWEPPRLRHLRSGHLHRQKLHRSHQPWRQAGRVGRVAVCPSRREGEDSCDELVDDVRDVECGRRSLGRRATASG